MERWIEAPGFPDYEISDHGQIRRSKAGRGARSDRVLSPYRKKSGHRAISLRIDGRYKNARLARLVCLAFVGPLPFPSAETRHRDGIPFHDHWQNLQWGTSTDNKADMIDHGTRRHGGDHWSAKLTDEDVDTIRAMKGTGIFQREIAERYGIAQSHVSRIWRDCRRAGVTPKGEKQKG